MNLGTYYGEYLAGEIKTKKNIYGIFAGTGIGGGYIADGKLVRGAGYTAGEIGHITVKLNGPRCNCGNRGCLEAIAGKVGVVKYLIKKTKNKKNSTLLDEIAPNWKKSLGSSALRKAWEHGDPLVQKAIKRSAQYIGVAASTIINAIGVEAIILGGGVIEELADIYIPIIENTIETNSMAEAGKSVTLCNQSLETTLSLLERPNCQTARDKIYSRNQRRPINGKRVAAIDIGSSSVRMLIAEITDGEVEIIDTLRQNVQLGKDSFFKGRILRNTINDCIRIINKFKNLCDEYLVTEIKAVATTAIREASNADIVLDNIYTHTGLEVETINATQETEYIHRVLTRQIPPVENGEYRRIWK